MPSPELILVGLSDIAHRFWYVAGGWHLLGVAALLAVALGWRPSKRQVASLAAAPLLSVGLFAFLTDNPFNGTAFLLLGIGSFVLGRRMADAPIDPGARWQVLASALCKSDAVLARSAQSTRRLGRTGGFHLKISPKK